MRLVKMVKMQTERAAEAGALAFHKWWQFWMGNILGRTSPRPAWCKLMGSYPPWRIIRQTPSLSMRTFPSTQPLCYCRGLHSPVIPVTGAASQGHTFLPSPAAQPTWVLGASPGASELTGPPALPVAAGSSGSLLTSPG